MLLHKNGMCVVTDSHVHFIKFIYIYIFVSTIFTPRWVRAVDISQEKMSSELFQLINAKDPIEFAKKHGIETKDNSVKVIIKVNPDVADITDITNKYNLEVKNRAEQLVEAYVPIKNLGPLAKEDKIIYIRRPRRFILW